MKGTQGMAIRQVDLAVENGDCAKVEVLRPCVLDRLPCVSVSLKNDTRLSAYRYFTILARHRICKHQVRGAIHLSPYILVQPPDLSSHAESEKHVVWCGGNRIDSTHLLYPFFYQSRDIDLSWWQR